MRILSIYMDSLRKIEYDEPNYIDMQVVIFSKAYF
jgi:hypothetical protein